MRFFYFSFLFLFALQGNAQQAPVDRYLDSVKIALQKQWPRNATVNFVYHGHSVPSGYFTGGIVNSLQAYPHLHFQFLKAQYPKAVINTIVTAIGGEQSEQGQSRFSKDVLAHQPTVLFIDYGLNDRGIGLERAQKAWRKMIEEALRYPCLVILMTPTPDLNEDILDPQTPLALHAQQIRDLANEYHVGLVDSYAIFQKLKQDGHSLEIYMSQNNHPNEKGHQLVADAIAKWSILK